METVLTDITNPRASQAPGGPLAEVSPRRPLLTIRPKSGWRALDLLQVWQYRDLLLTLAARDVKLRYRQTALGALWVVINPLISAGIFSFVFGKVAHLSSDHVPYFAFSYVGMLAWTAFAG